MKSELCMDLVVKPKVKFYPLILSYSLRIQQIYENSEFVNSIEKIFFLRSYCITWNPPLANANLKMLLTWSDILTFD